MSLEKSVCEDQNYKALYEEHSTSLRNFMYYKCGNLDQAEDYSHEAFVKMWERCKEVIFSKAKGYLFTIANRLFLNTVEHQKVVLKFERRTSGKVNTETPEYLVQEEEFKLRLEKAISELPEGQREAFLMNRIDKMSYNEIAEALGVSVKAIEKRIHKALINLKERVGELKGHKF